MEEIKELIRTIPDFPKKGIQFRDITTLLKDKNGFHKVIDILAARYKDSKIDKVVGIESRGFIIAGALAHCLGAGFVPIRKIGKLPGKKHAVVYELEYGTDTVEIHEDAIDENDNVLLVDDLIATGGTAAASVQLIERLGGKIIECAFIVELPDLHGRKKLQKHSVFSLVSFEGD
jgi:adenine phosphoribosyltransferase